MIDLIGELITKKARREFARTLNFSKEEKPAIPPCDSKQIRLLYAHIPFCEKLCPYCSFNRVVFEKTLCRNYFDALRREVLLYKENGYDFDGLYVGGGTPTILMDELEETLKLIRDCFKIREISVETNPNHLTEINIKSLKRAGVNRLSVGVQSFDDGLLKAMDRYGKYGSGEAIAEQLYATLGHFDTLNADMIFNFSSQTPEMLNRDLDILVEMEIDQVTYYPLMVSDSTRKTITTNLGRVNYHKEKRFYHQIVERLTRHYRLSSAWCFSRKDSMIDEYIVNYDEYAGLGSGSIGYLNGTCYANTFNIGKYIDQVNRGEIPLMASRRFTKKEQVRYDFLMKLFGMELDTAPLRKKYGADFYQYIWYDIFASFLIGGLRYRRGRFYLTNRGRYYWVIMMREFFTAVNNFRDFCLAETTINKE
ncbi:MAG: coproporphyrinogen III oxidase family protein [Syntrophales bacterium]|nr:coproporphyrinogen III oxidase family protein [Syntrophales bacterium]